METGHLSRGSISSVFSSSSSEDDGIVIDHITGPNNLDIDGFLSSIDINATGTDISMPTLTKHPACLIDLDFAVEGNEQVTPSDASRERAWLKRLCEPDSPNNIIYEEHNGKREILAAEIGKLVELVTICSGTTLPLKILTFGRSRSSGGISHNIPAVYGTWYTSRSHRNPFEISLHIGL